MNAPRKVSDIEKMLYDRVAGRLVENLRRLADDVERAALPSTRSPVGGGGCYANAAERVHHTLAWGGANLNADALIGCASRVDLALAVEDWTEDDKKGCDS